MNNPYSPPNSSLKMQSDGQSADPYSPKRPMLIAASALSALTIASTYNDYYFEQKYGTEVALMYVLVGIGFAIYSVFLMNKMANGIGADGKVRRYTSWGFFWRVFCSHFLCLVPGLAIKYAFFGASIEPTLQFFIITSAAAFLVLPAVIWAAFSNNRRAQYDWLLTLTARV